jgi:DNA-binding SARP family transcriptional activator
MPAIEFRILGPLDVLVDRQAVRIRGFKSQIVLSCLLIAKSRQASVPHLIDAVWGAVPPVTAIKQIRNTVSDLRRMLHPYAVSITAQNDGYRLGMEDFSFDLETFHAHLATARRLLAAEQAEEAIIEFRSALNLWRGRVLDGIESDKLRPSIAELNEMRLSAAEQYFDLQLSLNRHQVVAAELAAWAKEYPFRERLCAHYISALHRSGARAQALDTYEQTRRQLAESLGISPGTDLTRVYQEILDEDAKNLVHCARNHTVLTAAPGNLPDPVTHFTGRSAELETLAAAQRSARDSPLLVIDGMAGVGKTALAISLAHELGDQYPDGQLWVDLNSHASGSSPLADQATALRRLLAVLTAGKAILPRHLDVARH